MRLARTLPCELTVYTIGELYPQCQAWSHADMEHACLRVGAEAVAEVDAAGVQLLLSLSSTLQAQRRTLQLVTPSEALSAACQALGAGILVDNADMKGQEP